MPNVILKNKNGTPIEYSNVDTVVLPGNNPVPYNSLPPIEPGDNGKVLGVVDDQWDKMDIGGGGNGDAVYFTFGIVDLPGETDYEVTNVSMTFAEISAAIEANKFVYGISEGVIVGQWTLNYYASSSYVEFVHISNSVEYYVSIHVDDSASASANSLQGADGTDGQDGVGVPAGGQEGQILAKATDTDYDTEWINPPQSGGAHVYEIRIDGQTFDVTDISELSFINFLNSIYYNISTNVVPYFLLSHNSISGSFYLENIMTSTDHDSSVGKIIFRCDSVDKSGIVDAINTLIPGKFPDDTKSLDLVWERSYDPDTALFVETFTWSPIVPEPAIVQYRLPTEYSSINVAIMTAFQTWITSAIQSQGTVVKATESVDASALIIDLANTMGAGRLPILVVSDGTSRIWFAQVQNAEAGIDLTPLSATARLSEEIYVSSISSSFLVDASIIVKSTEVVVYGTAIPA